MVVALCIPPALALAQSPANHALPAGTRLDFIADDTINVDTVRAGGQFRVHLAQPLMLDGSQLAAAGTAARLFVTEKMKQPDGSNAIQIALGDFHLKQGEMPVVPVNLTITVVVPGTVVPAITQGSIERSGDRIVIRVPVPMSLSTLAPSAPYTAYPAVTPAPVVPGPRRGATPTPLPTTFNPPDAGDASAAPAASP